MKKYILILMTSLLAIASCKNLSDNPLIGKWQLKSVEREGTIVSPVDTVWYNFQSQSVFLLQVYDPQIDSVRMLFGLRTQQDKIVAIQLQSVMYDDLNYTDWDTTERSFAVEQVNKKHLLLRSEEGYLYSFIKF